MSPPAFAAVFSCSLSSPSLPSGLVSQASFPALVSAHAERLKKKKKKEKYDFHPCVLGSSQDTQPKKIPSVDLNRSNHAINELTARAAAWIPQGPLLHVQKHQLELGMGLFLGHEGNAAASGGKFSRCWTRHSSSLRREVATRVGFGRSPVARLGGKPLPEAGSCQRK